MRLGPFRLTRQRAARAVAGLVAAFMLTGNALAAAGLCALKAPDVRPATQQSAAREAHPCAGHLADELPAGAPAADHHCPTDDPSAQTRTVDVPAAQLMPGVAASIVDWTSEARQAPPLAVSDHPSELRPLYARLQRLRL